MSSLLTTGSSAVPALALVVVAALLLVENGTRLGVLLPTATPVIGLGWLSGTGSLPVPVAVTVCMAAILTGVSWGHRTARLHPGRALEPAALGRVFPPRAATMVDRLGAEWSARLSSHPVLTSAGAQLVAGVRTLSPRVAGRAGIPLRTVLTGAVPAATAWAGGLVLTGAAVGGAPPELRLALTLAGLPVLLVGATVVVLRRRRATRPKTVAVRPATVPRGWGLLRSSGVATVVVASVVATLGVTWVVGDPRPAAAATSVGAAPTGRTAPGTGVLPEQQPAAPVWNPDEAVQAALTAFGDGGQLAVLVTGGQTPGAPGKIPAAISGATVPSSAAWLPDRPFHTASLVKLYLAEGILHALRTTGEALPAADAARLQAALTTSDDDAASALWVAYDGAAVITEVAARYGLTGTRPPAQPGAWGQTVTTAADLALFLGAYPGLAHPDDAALLTTALSSMAPVAADGFDQRFGLAAEGASPPGAAVKQGWMCCVQGTRTLHSVGVVGGRVVVLLSEAPAEADPALQRAGVDAAARALGLPA